MQINIKRTLAYSSINHAGFILMALAASSAEGNRAVIFYLVAYTFMVAGSFGVATVVARRGDAKVSLEDYRGLSRTSPGLALVFTVFLLAQAGVPFTSGFVAKLYTVVASVNANATWLAIVAMVTSVIAAYLYLRIIVTMYMASPADETAKPVRVPAGARLALAVCLLVTIAAGVVPGPLTRVAGEAQPVVVNLPEPPGAPAADPRAGEQLGSVRALSDGGSRRARRRSGGRAPVRLREPVVPGGARRAPAPGPGVVPGGGAGLASRRARRPLVSRSGAGGRRRPGAVIADLSPGEWEIVDAFEGGAYDRRLVSTTPCGDAFAYVGTGVLRPLAVDWNRQAFADEALDAFVTSCAAWRSAGGR